MDFFVIPPSRVSFEIGLIEGAPLKSGRAKAVLIWNEQSRMVIVGINQQVVGGIVGDEQTAWADLAARLESEGLVAQTDAWVEVKGEQRAVWLFADPKAEYRTPAEVADAAHAIASPLIRAFEEGQEAVQRFGAGGADARRNAEQLISKVEGRCRDCGQPIEPTGRRGRPAVRCASCRVDTKPARVERPPTPVWAPGPPLADWSVIDVETTGLWPSVDRVVEIGVVRLSADGREIDAWTSLVDPDRDIGAGNIHGLSAFHLRGAPKFAEVAPSLLAMLSGTRIAAHNARFDTAFLTAEFARAGIDWGAPDALCTMTAVGRLRLTSSRQLTSVCAELGILHEDAHCAMADARAAASLMAHILPAIDLSVAVVPHLSDGPLPPRTRLRTDPPPPRLDARLGALADRVGVPVGLDASSDAASAYLALLDRVLEDRKVTDHEIAALADVAARWDISAEAARALHRAYLDAVWDLANADGVITEAERRDLAILSELLGVDLGSGPSSLKVAPARGVAGELFGRSVCFTGGSVVTIDGLPLTRLEQERIAADAGMAIKANVSRKLDILVLADPDSRSGKSKLADDLGIRKIAEPVFWRMLGVSID